MMAQEELSLVLLYGERTSPKWAIGRKCRDMSVVMVVKQFKGLLETFKFL
jgi:hypothetical protein